MQQLEQSSQGALSEEESHKVRKQLDRLLASHQFRNSRRYPALLRFLVEETLEGRADFLKERLVGIHVFGRPADYDTASDPIVRVTIAEVRKRIAQYYHSEEHDAEIRIELVTGRYVPEFRWRREGRQEIGPEEAPALQAPTFPVAPLDFALPADIIPTPLAVGVVNPAPPRRLRRVARVGGMGAALLVLLVGGVSLVQWLRPAALDQLWGPILAPRHSVLFCLPTDVGRKRGVGQQPVVEKPGGQTFLDHESLGENVVYSDMLAMLNVVDVLVRRHSEYRVRLNTATALDDLRQGPAVLIGGLDNDWTLRALEKLPYRFAGSDEESYWISDARDPGNRQWSLNLTAQYAAVTRDYALIARLHNEQTGKPEIIIAGIGMSGTAAAGEMVSDEHLAQEIRKRIGAGFTDHDFEVVISTDVVNGNAGSPRILAVAVW